MILSGGTTEFEGLPDRLRNELVDALPANTEVRVIAEAFRRYAVWRGASTLSSLSSFASQWVTKDEWDELGAQILQRKCSWANWSSRWSILVVMYKCLYRSLLNLLPRSRGCPAQTNSKEEDAGEDWLGHQPYLIRGIKTFLTLKGSLIFLLFALLFYISKITCLVLFKLSDL